MGLPQDMSGAYEEASLLHRVQRVLQRAGDGGVGGGGGDGGCSGKRLLLIHGLLDDNVHARHTLLLLQQLQQAQQQHVSLGASAEKDCFVLWVMCVWCLYVYQCCCCLLMLDAAAAAAAAAS